MSEPQLKKTQTQNPSSTVGFGVSEDNHIGGLNDSSVANRRYTTFEIILVGDNVELEDEKGRRVTCDHRLLPPGLSKHDRVVFSVETEGEAVRHQSKLAREILSELLKG